MKINLNQYSNFIIDFMNKHYGLLTKFTSNLGKDIHLFNYLMQLGTPSMLLRYIIFIYANEAYEHFFSEGFVWSESEEGYFYWMQINCEFKMEFAEWNKGGQ